MQLKMVIIGLCQRKKRNLGVEFQKMTIEEKGSILIRNDPSDNQIARHIFSRESYYVIRQTASLIVDCIFLSNRRINVKHYLLNIRNRFISRLSRMIIYFETFL